MNTLAGTAAILNYK